MKAHCISMGKERINVYLDSRYCHGQPVCSMTERVATASYIEDIESLDIQKTFRYTLNDKES